MSVELESVSKALVDIDAVSAGIANLTKQYGGVVYEVGTTTGMAEAKAARLAIREPRYSVERIRKDAKKPLLELGKRLDAEAARIERELLKLEDPIHNQITAEEQRKENERQAKIDAELARMAALQKRIDDIRAWPQRAAGRPAEVIKKMLDDATGYILLEEEFQERTAEAHEVLETSMASLRGLHAERVNQEAEQERIRLEREELARLRAAQAQRDAQAQATRDEEDRQARKRRDEEQARHDEQLRQQREESARLEAERKAALDAEERRVAAAREEIDRKTAALRAAQEKPPELPRVFVDAPLTRRGEAVKIPTAVEIVRHLAEHYKAHPDTIIEWLRAMDLDKVSAAA